ncbi:hypothetical protein KIW84_065541, partial [Lathyrus oleraceus]
RKYRSSDNSVIKVHNSSAMASFSVNVTASPSPLILQRRPFSNFSSSTHHQLQDSHLQNKKFGAFSLLGFAPFSFNLRRSQSRFNGSSERNRQNEWPDRCIGRS